MLKIGDFSKLGHVTVKALRHYAQLGLLKPAWTDRYSGYRYYSLQQLTRLNRILALKDLGFSLEQIAGLLEEDVPVEQLRGMLRRKQNELESRLRAEQNRLAFVSARLEQIEQSGHLNWDGVLVKSLPAVPVACVSEVVPLVERLGERTMALVEELNAWLARKGLRGDGPWMALQPVEEYRERDIPVELAVQVDPALMAACLDGPGRVRLRVLPAVREVASLIHSGPSETVGQSYALLYAWMEANRRRPGGQARELYLRDAAGGRGGSASVFSDRPREPGMTQVVEIQIPVEPLVPEFSFVNANKEKLMEPKIVTRPAFNVIGLCYQGKNQNQEIGALWGQFNQRGAEVAALAVPNTYAFGVCGMPAGLPEGHFEYVAGLEVPEGAPIPEGMVLRRVPANKYAVFAHRGLLSGLRETYNNIYQVWLPQSGLEVLPGYDMEVYTEEWQDDRPESVFYIYVPVK